MHDIRLIAMDMDGTLLNDSQQISKENRSALDQAVKLGIQIAICSGRTASDISYYASDAQLDTCNVIGLNGCCCLVAPHQPPYAIHAMKTETAQAVVEVLLRNKLTFGCFQANRIVVIQHEDSVPKLNWGTHVARNNPLAYVYGEDALNRYAGEGICKIVYIDEDCSPRIENVRRELVGISGLQVTASWTNNLELMPEGINKATALQALSEKLGIRPEQVMALGDYDNDIDMLCFAGYGIAMGNASQSVKKIARDVTSSNAEHGVAAAIHKYILQ